MEKEKELKQETVTTETESFEEVENEEIIEEESLEHDELEEDATSKEEVETAQEKDDTKEETAPIEKPKKETSERPEKNGRNIVSRILNVVLWIVLFAWMALVVIDYVHVKNEEDPQFCWFNDKTTDYTDGSVHECTGLGYKVINYDRESFKAIEFGPFWITDRTAKEDNK